MQVAERAVRVWGLRTLGHVCGAEEGMASGDAGERSSGWVHAHLLDFILSHREPPKV